MELRKRLPVSVGHRERGSFAAGCVVPEKIQDARTLGHAVRESHVHQMPAVPALEQ
jgi:hypothetical protein